VAKAGPALDRSVNLPYCHHLSVNPRITLPTNQENVKHEMCRGCTPHPPKNRGRISPRSVIPAQAGIQICRGGFETSPFMLELASIVNFSVTVYSPPCL
jgi:hypothetical protein